MRRKVKTILALLMALALVMSCVGTEGFSVFAENVTASETSSAAETASDSQAQALSETESTPASEETTSSGKEETTEASGEDLIYQDGSAGKPEESAPSADSTTVSENEIPSDTSASSETETTEELTTEESEETSEEETSASEEDWLEYIPEEQPEGITVTAYAAEGVFPEDVKMTATFLGTSEEDGAEAAEAAQALDDSGVAYDGFLALDISFYDAYGTEIEPEEGSVQVKIELAAEMLPEGTDVDTLEVQHLEEKEDGVEVRTVADTADAVEGTVEVAEDAGAVTAEFSVDGFSTFTITWKKYPGSEKALLKVTYWDSTNNKSLEGPANPAGLDLEQNSGEEFDFSSLDMPAIEGYQFDHAEYSTWSWDGQKWEEVTAVCATLEEGPFWNRWTWKVKNSSGKWVDLNNVPNIRLCYIENSEPDIPVPPASATVTTGKSAILNNDGTYTLNLSVSGDRGSVSEKQKVDVLFILDESNSMMEYWGRNTRIAEAKKAIQQIIGYGDDVGLSDNTALDVRYALVGFYGGAYDGAWNDAKTECGWTSDTSTLYNATPGWLNDQRDNGGTNYEAGFRTGKGLLDEARSDALKVVIFISDGNPGYYYNNSGNTDGTGNPGSSYNENALKHAVNECKNLTTDYFYFVGVTNSVSTNVFSEIVDAVNAPDGNKASYSASSADDLLDAFEDIAEQITFFDTNNVSLIDPLSEYADLVTESAADGTYTFTLLLEHRDSVDSEYAIVDSETISVTANTASVPKVTLQGGTQSVGMKVFVDRTDTGDETIRVEFDDEYQLAQNYRYTISAVITPSQLAKDEYAENGTNAYNGVGENGTGTHSGQSGFWSNNNEEAKVNFTPITTTDDGQVTPGDPDEAPFPKPVIQVAAGTLEIEKTIIGLTDDAEAYSQALTGMKFTITCGDEIVKEISGGEMLHGENGILSCTIENLSPGEYTIVETGGEADGYTFTTNPDSKYQIVMVEKDQTKKASFTNTYKRSERLLTIDKIVDGNMSDDDLKFQFILKLEKDGEEYTQPLKYNGQNGTLENQNGSYAFQLSGSDEPIVIHIPYGTTFTVSEDAKDYDASYNFQIEGENPGDSFITGSSCEGTLTENVTVTFRNEKKVSPPTGLFQDIAPFSAMLLTAAAGGIWFGLSSRKKHSA